MSPTVSTAKLFFLIRARKSEGITAARRRIALDFTPIDIETPTTMAGDESVQFASTTVPIQVSELPDIKRFAMKLEKVFAEQGVGPVNLDVGYVADIKAVVASRHNGNHKIELARGVYGEIVLKRNGTGEEFASCPWTDEVYFSPEAHTFFDSACRKSGIA